MTETKEDAVSIIRDHLYDNADVIATLKNKSIDLKNRIMRVNVEDENGKTTYLDVTNINQINSKECRLKKNIVKIDDDFIKPIMLGIDTSSGPIVTLEKGNELYALGFVLSCKIDGDISKSVISNVWALTKFCIIASNKKFESKSRNSCIIQHNLLQENYRNMMKVIKEGYMPSELLKNVSSILISYDYRYNRNEKDSVIIMKDGPLFTWKLMFGEAMLKNEISSRFLDDYNLYSTISKAALRGIPTIGITKSVYESNLGKHFDMEDVLDYSIIKELAKNDIYFYVGPIRWEHPANPNFVIDYSYLYLESSFSPLRIEILSNLLPRGIKEEDIIEDILKSLKKDNSGVFKNKNI